MFDNFLKNKQMKNKVDVLLGLQWGDEGKGKIVDVLTERYDVIARFHGGANAGHTLKMGNIKHVLHLIPSGIFHANKLNVIGNGVVIDPLIFMQECLDLKQFNIDCVKQIFIANRAHLITPTHRLLDAVYEQSKGANKIGSTLKGIGPAYTDKVARLGLRIIDVNDKDFASKYNTLRNTHLNIAKAYNFDIDDFTMDHKTFAEYEKEWLASLDFLKQFTFIDCESFINGMLESGKSVLAEGAQGTMLDIDFGTYPFVTSSNSVSAGVCTGLGVAPNNVGRVYGIAKAYCTRVGAGPFPTEQDNETGSKLREYGAEFGATTGRPRRCGWMDMTQLKYSVMINGVTDLIITKPDVLNTFDKVLACTAYHKNGKPLAEYPCNLADNTLQPVYAEFEGWKTDIANAKTFDTLPENFKTYIKAIEKHVGVAVKIISTGPDRNETIFVEK